MAATGFSERSSPPCIPQACAVVRTRDLAAGLGGLSCPWTWRRRTTGNIQGWRTVTSSEPPLGTVNTPLASTVDPSRTWMSLRPDATSMLDSGAVPA